MRVKKILIVLIINSLILLIPTIAVAEGIGYQFDWDLAPLKYVDNRFYIERIIDLRPEDQKNSEPDQNRPIFLTTDIEDNLKSYLNKSYPKVDYKTPLILKIKRLHCSYWDADNRRYAKIEIIMEFHLHIEGKIGKVLEIDDFSIADSDLGIVGLYEKSLCSVIEKSLKAYSNLNQETIIPVWEEYQEEEKKQDSSSENNISSNEDISPDVNTSTKIDEQIDFGFITGVFSEKGGGIGGVAVDDQSRIQMGVDFSVCNLYPSEEAKEKTEHWGIDINVLLPIIKHIYLGLGTGLYYELFSFSKDELYNYGGSAELQFLTEKYLIGYGYHRLKGHFVRIGYRM